ncbi:MAG: 50S ribosomal protein P1, partial [Desulfurococcaceae archaeon]
APVAQAQAAPAQQPAGAKEEKKEEAEEKEGVSEEQLAEGLGALFGM